jgi:hypothetical protein
MDTDPFDVEFSDEDSDDASPADDELYTGDHPLLLKPRGLRGGSNCLRVKSDNRYVIGLTIDVTEDANNVHAHGDAIAFVSTLLEKAYKAEVASTSVDVDTQSYRVCALVPANNILPLRNCVGDNTLLAVVNNAYQEKEQSPTVRLDDDWRPSNIVRARNWLRTKQKFECFHGIMDVRPLPYSWVVFSFICSRDVLAVYDPEGIARARIDIPSPPIDHDRLGALLTGIEEDSSGGAGGSAAPDSTRMITVDEYRDRKKDLSRKDQKALRVAIWTQLAADDS